MSNLTYIATARPGQAIAFPSCDLIKGWVGEVKRGDVVVTSSGVARTKEGALRWATTEAARYRAYRQQHGEGIEDGQKRKAEAKRAEQRRANRIYKKRGEAFELLQALASDAELVSEWLPPQALARIAKVRELVAFVETDTPA
jgi:hypothetical protein